MPKILLPLLTVLLALANSATAATFDHDHRDFTRILASHVKNKKVDYNSLKVKPAPLNAYLDSLAAVPKRDFNGWSKDRQPAFLINLYNAGTLKLVVDHHIPKKDQAAVTGGRLKVSYTKYDWKLNRR